MYMHCVEWLRKISQLDETQELVPIHHFYSRLNQASTITEQEYTELQALWVEKGFQSMRDFLIYYNT